MFCKKCGLQLPDDANFCSKCGAQQEGQSNNDPTPGYVRLSGGNGRFEVWIGQGRVMTIDPKTGNVHQRMNIDTISSIQNASIFSGDLNFIPNHIGGGMIIPCSREEAAAIRAAINAAWMR